jgi:transcriptional regulator with XRE-family HTH domain
MDTDRASVEAAPVGVGKASHRHPWSRVPGLAQRLREARGRIGVSIAKLALESGVSRSLIRLYESGDREPAPFNLVKLCDTLDVSADWLLGLARPSEGTRPRVEPPSNRAG